MKQQLRGTCTLEGTLHDYSCRRRLDATTLGSNSDALAFASQSMDWRSFVDSFRVRPVRRGGYSNGSAGLAHVRDK